MFANEIRLVVQCNVKGSYFFRRYFCACQIPNFCKLNKSVSVVEPLMYHTAYSWSIMCQKWEGDCGLWVLNEIIWKIYTESLKKIVGAVWELPAK